MNPGDGELKDGLTHHVGLSPLKSAMIKSPVKVSGRTLIQRRPAPSVRLTQRHTMKLPSAIPRPEKSARYRRGRQETARLLTGTPEP